MRFIVKCILFRIGIKELGFIVGNITLCVELNSVPVGLSP
jgi:hypothetical protein